MQFVMSYSCGKDSALALHRMVQKGHVPVALLVMVNRELGRSWFHGVDRDLLGEISDALGIPLLAAESTGEAYHIRFEQALRQAKAMGAERCVFGDIDIADHAAWGRARCEAAGMEAEFPLWQEDREALTREGDWPGLSGADKMRPEPRSAPLYPGAAIGREDAGHHAGARGGSVRGKWGVSYPGRGRAAVSAACSRGCGRGAGVWRNFGRRSHAGYARPEIESCWICKGAAHVWPPPFGAAAVQLANRGGQNRGLDFWRTYGVEGRRGSPLAVKAEKGGKGDGDCDCDGRFVWHGARICTADRRARAGG